MATTLKTPGVYINELNAFPNSVVGVPTAVPAFIGYTEFAMNGNVSLLNTPFSITSMVEYNQYFGGAPVTQYGLQSLSKGSSTTPDFSYDNTGYSISPSYGNFMLYNSINHFFSNGGGQCYIVSIGNYGLTSNPNTAAFYSGLSILNLLNTDLTTLINTCIQNPSASSSSSSSSSSSAPVESNGSKLIRAALNTVLSDGVTYQGAIGSFNSSSSSSSSSGSVTTFQAILGQIQTAASLPIYAGTTGVTTSWATIAGAAFIVSNDLALLKSLNITGELSSTSILSAAQLLQKDMVSTIQAMNTMLNAGVAAYIQILKVSVDALNAGVDLLINQPEPTILVIPDAMSPDVSDNDAYSLQEKMLNHCGGMQSRVAILDIRNGWKTLKDPGGSPVDAFRNAVSSNFYDFGATYYPWLNTTVLSSSDVNFTYLTPGGITTLQTILYNEVSNGVINKTISASSAASMNSWIAQLTVTNGTATPAATLSAIIGGFSNRYTQIMNSLLGDLNLLPPSPAMAGVYSAVDTAVGVWKAPANVALASVTSPTVTISDFDQQDLNAPLTGKAVNAIRAFTGEGILVWGARTLDANSLDWRYINVRRTMIFLEQSIKIASKAYVFQPNVANTWVSINSMISNFLNSQWKAGALAGASPADAYSVQVGLGSTMTADDILNGIMNITVLVAVSRPAEFIVITFQQQMQKS